MGSASVQSFSWGSAPLHYPVTKPNDKDAEDLIPSLWREFPPELLEKVLTKLPVPALLKFQRVSKKWKAFIQSEGFAHSCNSGEPTVFYLDEYGDMSYIAIPDMKTNSWEKHYLDFLSEDEGVFDLVASDGGLLCYRVVKKMFKLMEENKEIVLVVHNPLTRKWRHLIVPYRLETPLEMLGSLTKMLVGLKVDRETGTYKVLVAFLDKHCTRSTFIFDSPSNSWKISVSLSPVAHPHYEFVRWDVKRSICCGGELFWVVKEGEPNVLADLKSLVKYNFELDAWTMASQRSPDEGNVHVVHNSSENLPVMANFLNSVRFPEEFSSLVPSMAKFGVEDLEVLLKGAGAGNLPGHFIPRQVAYAGGKWFIGSDSSTSSVDVFGLPFRILSADVLVLSESPPTMRRLPTVYDRSRLRLGSFVATFKAFV